MVTATKIMVTVTNNMVTATTSVVMQLESWQQQQRSCEKRKAGVVFKHSKALFEKGLGVNYFAENFSKLRRPPSCFPILLIQQVRYRVIIEVFRLSNSKYLLMTSAKKKETASMKMAVLRAIEEEKRVIFSKFDTNITHEMKVNAWSKVLCRAKAVGLCDQSRSWEFVRDKMFGVWKSRTLDHREAGLLNSAKLDQILAKLDKLDTLETKIDNVSASLNEEVKKIDSKLDAQGARIVMLERQVAKGGKARPAVWTLAMTASMDICTGNGEQPCYPDLSTRQGSQSSTLTSSLCQ
ncbi:hypothetical protein GE061_008634 [Apolygus lucorum]|uniref:Regulatory protein zeste n=1 Tax=Apolygus lucorum TaxID=248454 RepID=A0A8S9WN78_APOLU|nr:hypothetical protein GE061_008634 [Apolygus lucorum]